MFQPQETPAFASFYSSGYADNTIPNYSYQQGPLGGPGPGPGGGSGGANGRGGHRQGLGAHLGGAATGTGSGGALNSPLSVFPFSPLDLGHGALEQDPFNTPNQQLFAPLHRSHLKMESGGIDDDLAAQEAAARGYQPQLKGPLVGEKTSSHVIAQEYAKADPVYVAKTVALPNTYSHCRGVQGDGNCGWRAIGFSYFELLIQQGSLDLVNREHQRLLDLNDYIFNVGGYDKNTTEDMIDETLLLFQEISTSLAHGPDAAMAVLVDKFNDLDCSNGIIYHLRLLAASYLKGNPANYEAFLESGISGYCSELELPYREIEQMGVQLLVEILLRPLNFAIEIAYLDRSPAAEVNTYRFPADAPDQDPNSAGRFIYLLYRPDHYDILYKSSQAPVSFQPEPLNVEIHRVSFAEQQSFPQSHGFSVGPSQDGYSSTIDLSPLTLLPSFGGGLSGLGALGGSFGGSPLGDYSPSPQPEWFSSPFAETPIPHHPAPPRQQQQQQQQPPPPTSLPTQPANQTVSPTTTTHSIRFSRYQWEENSNAWPEQTFQTNTFKNSHFNTAHFNNPHFQPEEYRPGVDDGDGRCERSGRKRSHGKASAHSTDDGLG